MDTLKNLGQRVRNSISGTSEEMDNAAYRETEAPRIKTKEVKIQLENRDNRQHNDNLDHSAVAEVSTSTTGTSTAKICKPEVCRRARTRYQQAQGSESPWHRQKTITCVVCLVLFGIWIIVYATCSTLGLV